MNRHLRTFLRKATAIVCLVGYLAATVNPLYAVTLTNGDIAITGMKTNGSPDAFTFVTFIELDAGTRIFFTDNGWTGSAFRGATSSDYDGSEGTLVFEVKSGQTIAAGTVINSTLGTGFTGYNFQAITGAGALNTTGNLAFANSGDQLYAFSSSASMPTTGNPLNNTGAMTHLSAMATTASWTNATDSATGSEPISYAAGTSYRSSSNQNGSTYFNVTTALGANASLTKAQWLTALGNSSNWSTSTDAAFTLPTTTFTLTSSGGASAQNTTLNVTSGTTTDANAYSGSTDANTAGSGALIKTGLGTLQLTGSSFYTGSTQIQEGVVSVATLTGTTGPLGNGGSITIGTGSTAGTLAYTGVDVTSARAYSLGAGGGTIDVSANNLTVSTGITGTGGLTKSGAGTLTLTGNNTYTGNTVVSGGVLDLNGGSSGIDDNATVTIQNGATFKSTGDNETLGPIVLTSGTIVTDGANQFRSPSFTVSQGAVNGILANKSGTTAALTKTTAGTVTINAAQAYTGATNVNAGTLALGASGAIATSPTVNVASGATLDVSAVTGGFTLGSTQTLAGAGSVVGSAAVAGTVNPGDSGAIGTLTLGATTLNGGGVLNISLFDAASTAGTGWDLLGTDALTFANSSGSKFTINLSSASSSGGAAGNATNFNNVNDASFKIVGASSFGSSFDANAFTLNTNGFTNGLGGGTWALTSLGSDIYVSFTAGQALNWVGGSGNWAPTGGTNWSGGAWNSAKTATFAGTAGTVTVDNAGVSADRGLDFGVTGYTVTGGPIALSGSNSVANTVTVGSGSATVASVITGNAGLTKAGAGSLILAGDNSFTGGTQINAGTVQLGDGGTAGSIAGGVTIGSGATLAVNRSDALTLAGNLTGAGSLSKAGDGTLTLSGSNDHAGGTTVTAGAVAVDGVARLGSGVLTLNGGRLNYTGGVGTLASGSIGASSGTFDIGTGGDLTVTTLTGTANPLVKEGVGTLRVPTLPTSFSANAGVLSTAQLGTYNAGTDLANAGTIEFTGSNTRVNLNVNQTGAGTLRLTQTGQSVANTGSNITGTAANPIALAVGSGRVNIGATSGNTLRLNGAISGTGNVNFAVGSSGGAGVVVLGAASTFTGNVVVNSSANGVHRLGVNNAIPTTAGVTFSGTAGSIDLNGFNQQLTYLASGASGGIYNSAAGLSTLTIDGTTSTTYARAIGTSGSANIALVKAGSSTLTLSGSSPFTGGVTINGGAISVAADSALGASAGGITLGGGTLEMTSGFTLGSGRTITALANTTSTLAVTTGTVSYGGAFTGSGNLDKAGAGWLVVSNASSDYTGLFTITAGTLEVTGSNAFANATLRQAGGELLLAPVGGGEVTIPDLDGSGGTTTIGDGATAVVGGSGNSSYNGQIRGQGGLKKVGNGRLTLTGANDFAGDALVDSGILELAAGGSITAPARASNGGQLKVNGRAGGTVTIDAGGILSGSGTLGGLATIAGTHAPGNSPGLQTAEDGLSYNASAVLAWELSANTNSLDDRGVLFDAINVTGGNLTITSGATIDLIFTDETASTVVWNDPFWNEDRSWTIIDFTSDGTSTGVFALGTIGLDMNGASLASARPSASFSVNNVGGDIVLSYVAVPEPSTVLLGGLGLGLAVAGWAVRRRRTRLNA